MSLFTITESGQTLAQNTGCVDILLDIFRYFCGAKHCDCIQLNILDKFHMCHNSTVLQVNFDLIGCVFAEPHSPFHQRQLPEHPMLPKSINFGHLCVVLSVDVSTIPRMVMQINVVTKKIPQYPCHIKQWFPPFLGCEPILTSQISRENLRDISFFHDFTLFVKYRVAQSDNFIFLIRIQTEIQMNF